MLLVRIIDRLDSGAIAMRISRLLFFALLALISVSAVKAENLDPPVDITPGPSVDESLFLINSLQNFYSNWPKEDVGRDQLAAWITDSRRLISGMRAAIRTNDLGGGIAIAYDDCLKMIDYFESYLANLGAIDRSGAVRESEDSAAAAGAGFRLGFNTARQASENGASTDDSILGGSIVGIIGSVYEDYTRSKARNEARQLAIDAEQRKLNATWTSTIESAKSIAEKLERKNGWNAGEAGFDNFTSESFGAQLARRPRDPFLIANIASIRVPEETPANIMGDARRCLDAARLVPSGRAYDIFRRQFVSIASELAVMASARSLTRDSYSTAPSPFASEALRICKRNSLLSPIDSTGRNEMLIARSLACLGKYQDAVDAASPAASKWKRDPINCYRFTKMLSLAGKHELAGDWLENAYQKGFDRVEIVREDQDLAGLKKHDERRFQKLTTVKTAFQIKYGVFNDDIVIVNKSPFCLTNIYVDMKITQGSRVWRPDLRLAYLGSGASYTFSNVVSIPNSRYDSAVATLHADQGID